MSYRSQEISLHSSLPTCILDGPLPPAPKTEDIYDNWGFTIYRTCYGEDTDLCWESLLQAIRDNVRLAINAYHRGNADPGDREVEAAKLMLELFRLDDRSDSSLAGRSLDELRDRYPQQPFSWTKLGPGDTEGPPYPRVFLVADAEVLSDVRVGKYCFKCVDMNFFQRSYVHNWQVPQSYYGWMLMGPLAVLGLWQRLWRSASLEEDLAPHVRFGQPINIWDPFEPYIGWP